MLPSHPHQLCTAVNTHLGEDRPQVILYGVDADLALAGDFLVGQPSADILNELPFPRGQLAQPGVGGSGQKKQEALAVVLHIPPYLYPNRIEDDMLAAGAFVRLPQAGTLLMQLIEELFARYEPRQSRAAPQIDVNGLQRLIKYDSRQVVAVGPVCPQVRPNFIELLLEVQP